MGLYSAGRMVIQLMVSKMCFPYGKKKKDVLTFTYTSRIKINFREGSEYEP